jgi:hypothetical protein
MKNKLNRSLQTGLLSAACGVMLLGSASLGLAQNTNPTNTFDSASSTTSFVVWWGTAAMSWDSTLDAANDPASGSVRYVAPFVGSAGEQFMTFFTIANRWGWDFGYQLDATTYTNLSFDIKVDPTSGQRNNANDFGWLEIGLTTGGSGPGTTYLPGRAIPLSATNWTRFDYPLTPSMANIDQVNGFFVKMWSNGDHTNSLTFNLDNFMVTKPTAPVVIPPPTVSLAKNTSGLNLVASGTGQYDRQQIRTVDSSFGWVGATEPVTYEFTIKEAPDAAHPGFQAHLFLVPNSADTAASIDWNAPNLFWLNIQNLANGGAEVAFRYKTNCPGANNMLFNTDPAATNQNGVIIGVGNLGTITSTTALGTWKLTLSNDTNITVVAADGSSTNYTITADAAALFSGTVQAFFGAQPNNVPNLGLGYVFSKAKISTTSGTLIEDDFTGDILDTVKWAKQASDAPGVFIVPTNSSKSLVWTLPASGYSAEIATSVGAGSTWVAPTANTPFKIQTTMRLLLADSDLNSSASFFRLVKRIPSKLQTLLASETNAPGTVTGKTGTIDPIIVGSIVPVTINSVDPSWYIAGGVGHTVHLTISPEDPANFVDPDVALVNGTASISVQFNTPGNYTITATDVTDGSLAPGTSSTITVVNP